MRQYKPGEVADLLGVSVDTVRRWADSGRLRMRRRPGGHRSIAGPDLAKFLLESTDRPEPRPVVARSARNRFSGIVTKVIKDRVAAQVELQAGPFRLVALTTAEAATELGLEPGVLAVASVKATNVVIELPEPRR